MTPVQRKTRTQGRKRRSQQGLRPRAHTRCPNCSETKQHHAACPECGYVRPGLKLQLAREQ